MGKTITLQPGTRFYFCVVSQYFAGDWLPWAFQKVQLRKNNSFLEEGTTNIDGYVWFPTASGETYAVEEGTQKFVAVTVAGPNNAESRSDEITITGQAAAPAPTKKSTEEQMKEMMNTIMRMMMFMMILSVMMGMVRSMAVPGM
jgi:hypothetical protein